MQAVIPCRPDAWFERLRMRVDHLRGRCRRDVRHHVPRRAALALILAACALLPIARLWPGSAAHAAIASRAIEWPLRFDGRVLQPMALSPVEQRFASAFPGAIARFNDGERLLVLRRVDEPTRMLHPAADCYRGLGYRIEAARLERDAQQRLWRCFRAERGSGDGATALRVCERIEDPQGRAWTDASAWFWAAALGQSTGPWQAVTVVSPAGVSGAPDPGDAATVDAASLAAAR